MSLRDAAIQQALKTAEDALGNSGLVVMVAGGNSITERRSTRILATVEPGFGSRLAYVTTQHHYHI